MVRTICAFLATLLTIIQAYLLYSTGNGICFNDGCEIVEKLTTIPALYFNLVGAAFFGFVFFCSLISCINDSDNSEKYTCLLLSAALAAEAVLIFFQWSVARTFCSYCLIIFSFVLLLNLLSGWEQIVRGLLIFCAVLIASFSLQFDAGGAGKALPFGTIAQYKEEGNSKNLLLIFSGSCPHCEKVIDFLQEETTCNVAFNPVEKLDHFNFEDAIIKKDYDPRATIGFMRSIGMNGVPILIAPGEDAELLILNGTNEIIPYLRRQCRTSQLLIPELQEKGMSVISNKNLKFQIPSLSTKKEDVCISGDNC